MKKERAKAMHAQTAEGWLQKLKDRAREDLEAAGPKKAPKRKTEFPVLPSKAYGNPHGIHHAPPRGVYR